MIVLRKFHVKKDERALLFDRGDFVDILRPGKHLRFDPLRRLAIEKFALANPRFEHRLADFLLKEEPAIVTLGGVPARYSRTKGVSRIGMPPRSRVSTM